MILDIMQVVYGHVCAYWDACVLDLFYLFFLWYKKMQDNYLPSCIQWSLYLMLVSFYCFRSLFLTLTFNFLFFFFNFLSLSFLSFFYSLPKRVSPPGYSHLIRVLGCTCPCMVHHSPPVYEGSAKCMLAWLLWKVRKKKRKKKE